MSLQTNRQNMFNVEEIDTGDICCIHNTTTNKGIYVKDGMHQESIFLQQEKTTDIPFAGGATIFLDTGTGTFSLGSAFL